MAPATPASFTSCSRVLGSSRACCTNARGFSSSPEMVVIVDSPSTRASVAAATGARAQAPAHVREHNSTGRLCQAAAATTMGNMGAARSRPHEDAGKRRGNPRTGQEKHLSWGPVTLEARARHTKRRHSLIFPFSHPFNCVPSEPSIAMVDCSHQLQWAYLLTSNAAAAAALSTSAPPSAPAST